MAALKSQSKPGATAGAAAVNVSSAGPAAGAAVNAQAAAAAAGLNNAAQLTAAAQQQAQLQAQLRALAGGQLGASIPPGLALQYGAAAGQPAAGAAGAAGLQGLQALTDPYLGQSIGPIAGYQTNAALYRRFTPY